MSYMFYDCNALTTLDVSKFDTSSVTNMDSMFYGCNGLTTLDLSNFNTTNVKNMSNMFQSCRLTNLDLSNFNTSKVIDMSYMFQSCNNLSSLNVSGFDTGKVTDMGYMFNGCNGLTSLDLSNFSYRRIISEISSFVSYDSNLTSLKLGAEVPPVSSDILQGCIHYGFGETDGKILVPKGMLSQYQTATNWSNFAQYMEEYDVPETTYNFVTIGGTPVDSITTSEGLQTAPVTTPDDSSLVFKGWYFDEQFTKKVRFAYNNIKGGTITLYAKYGKFNPTTKAVAQVIEQSDIGTTVFEAEITNENDANPNASNQTWKCIWFKFTPTEDGNYYISDYTLAIDDMQVTIELEDGTRIYPSYNESNNQHIQKSLTAGTTYYYSISGWSGKLGAINFILNKE